MATPRCHTCRRTGKPMTSTYAVPFKGWDVPVKVELLVCRTRKCKRTGMPVDTAKAWPRLKRLAKKVLDAEPRVALFVRPLPLTAEPAWWPRTGLVPPWVQIADGTNWVCLPYAAVDDALVLPHFAISLAKDEWRDYYSHTKWEFREVLIHGGNIAGDQQGGQKA